MKRNEFHRHTPRAYLRRINLNGYSEGLSYINCGVGGSPFISFIVISAPQNWQPAGSVKKQAAPLPPFSGPTLVFYSIPSRICSMIRQNVLFPPESLASILTRRPMERRWQLTLSFVCLLLFSSLYVQYNTSGQRCGEKGEATWSSKLLRWNIDGRKWKRARVVRIKV